MIVVRNITEKVVEYMINGLVTRILPDAFHELGHDEARFALAQLPTQLEVVDQELVIFLEEIKDNAVREALRDEVQVPIPVLPPAAEQPSLLAAVVEPVTPEPVPVSTPVAPEVIQ